MSNDENVGPYLSGLVISILMTVIAFIASIFMIRFEKIEKTYRLVLIGLTIACFLASLAASIFNGIVLSKYYDNKSKPPYKLNTAGIIASVIIASMWFILYGFISELTINKNQRSKRI